MKKLISLLLTAVLVALPMHPARADQSTCDRVQTDIASGNAADLAALLLQQYPDITADQVDRSIGYYVVQSPVTTNECTVTWTVQPATDNVLRGCAIIVGVQLGLLGITIYVIYRVYNPPPPDPHKPDWEMYMTTNGMIMGYGGPVIN